MRMHYQSFSIKHGEYEGRSETAETSVVFKYNRDSRQKATIMQSFKQ